MILSSQTIDFVQFIMVGVLLAIVFDIFRAYRKYKKNDRKFVMIQDILFFLIALCILVFSILIFLDNSLRLYLFIAIFLGIVIYISFFSKLVIKIYIIMFKLYNKLLTFFLLPCSLIFQLIKRICIFLSKIVKITCKKIKYVIFYIYNRIKCVKVKFLKFNIQKRVKNEKFKKKKRSKKKKD
jgi:spore cortex biosynthesis protein YabQ